MILLRSARNVSEGTHVTYELNEDPNDPELAVYSFNLSD